MSVQIEAISRRRGELLKSEVLKLEREMTELVALRRALCLLNATRDRPKGSRRLYRVPRQIRAVAIWHRVQPKVRDL
jgi:hypothetical protein